MGHTEGAGSFGVGGKWKGNTMASIICMPDGSAMIDILIPLSLADAQELWNRSIRGPEQRSYLIQDIAGAVQAQLAFDRQADLERSGLESTLYVKTPRGYVPVGAVGKLDGQEDGDCCGCTEDCPACATEAAEAATEGQAVALAAVVGAAADALRRVGLDQVVCSPLDGWVQFLAWDINKALAAVCGRGLSVSEVCPVWGLDEHGKLGKSCYRIQFSL